MRRKLAYLLFGILALTSCLKTEIISPEPYTRRITVLPGSAYTKSAIDGTEFPSDRTFLMSAYYNAEEGASDNYFTSISFSKNGSVWSADKYWPQNGSLDVLCVSTDGLTPSSVQWGDNVSTSYQGVFPDNSVTQTDILYSVAKNLTGQSGAVPMTFSHAEAVLVFTAKTTVQFDSTANKGITIDRIRLNKAYHSGILTITDTLADGGHCKWTGLANKKDLFLLDKTTSKDSLCYNVPTTAMDIHTSGNGMGIGKRGVLVPEQAQISFTVFFTVHNGKDDLNNNLNSSQQYTYVCSGNWSENKKYHYLISLNLYGIIISPSVEDWNAIDNDIEIGPKSTLKITSSPSSVSNTGEEFTVSLKNTLSDTISFKIDSSWVSFVSKSKDGEAESFVFSALTNAKTEQRSTNIRFTNGTDNSDITITQNASPEVFSIPKNSCEITYGSPVIMEVTSNVNYTVTTEQDWLSLSNENDIWTINAVSSTTASDRVGTVTFTSEKGTVLTLTLTQKKITDYKVTCSPYDKSLNCNSQTFTTTITSNTSYTITYEGDWLSQNSLSDNVLIVNVTENTGTQPREGAVVFNYKNLAGEDKQYRCFVTQYGVQDESCYLVATYNVTSAGNTKILYSTSSVQTMYVDGSGQQTTPSTQYNFTTTGEHTIKFILKNDTRSMSSMFEGCTVLTSVDGTHMTWDYIEYASFMFNQCSNLTNVQGLENWVIEDHTRLNPGYIIFGTSSPTTAMFQLCSKYQHLELPKTKRIDSFMINHLSNIDNTSITIPSCVEIIGGGHTFYNTGKDGVFTQFIVEPGNTHFKTIDGCLYTMDGKEFVACPRSPVVADRTFEIAEGVTKLGELCFNRQQVFDKLVLPDSYTITEYTSGDRGGGINYGNSLSVALYCYTSVNEYSVKNTNPNYIAYDGCIYSKDGTHLIAVPTNKIGVVTIKDGCTHINREAFWYDVMDAGGDFQFTTITGLSIPASVTSIESNQIKGFNNMVTNKGWIITIDPNNTVYTTDANGKIIAK